MKTATLSAPEIAASDLEAARRFLLGDSADGDANAAPARAAYRPASRRSFHDLKSPTCHHGIARARHRSAVRSAD